MVGILAVLAGVLVPVWAGQEPDPPGPGRITQGSMAAGPLAADGAERYWTVDHLPTPPGERIEAGGLAFLPDGRLAVSTRRGRVWIISDPMAENPADAQFSIFADGLDEGLGLAVIYGVLHVVQRGEISRLMDVDGDGACDRIETVANGWGLSGNYHEFAFGLPVAPDGSMFISLNVGFFSPNWWAGGSVAPWRGWVLKVGPDGTTTPWAWGLRSPCGLGWNAAGDLFATDNQGDWMPAGPLFHIQKDRFYGHPASLRWTDGYQASQTIPSLEMPPPDERTRPALWFPYGWSRSAGSLVHDSTGGAFGPFADQLIVAELTNGALIRADLEKVRGEYQGACFPLRAGVGSAIRVAFAPDGTLFCGLTNRGWGGAGPESGIARVRWTGVTPLEIEHVRLQQDGFKLEFSRALAVDAAPTARAVQYDYDYWWEYGSPERDLTALPVISLELAADRMSARIVLDGLESGHCVRVALSGAVDEEGRPMLHNEFAYTVNQLPAGPLSAEHVAKVVPPPPARANDEEGWLRLTWGDAFDAWDAEGWELCGARVDPVDPTRLVITEGNSALVNSGYPASSDFVGHHDLGDIDLEFGLMLPEGGATEVLLMGRYPVSFRSGPVGSAPTAGAFASILGATGAGAAGRMPSVNTFRGAGAWHDVSIGFRAPRFDADGQRTEAARIEYVRVDALQVHGPVEFTGDALEEVPFAPLTLRGGLGSFALGAIRVRPRNSPHDSEGRWHWIDGTPLVHASWDGGEPNDAAGGEDHAVLRVGRRRLNDLHALKGRAHGLLQATEAGDTGPEAGGTDWVHSDSDGLFYGRTPRAMDWFQARDYARKQGADLAVLPTAAHFEWVIQNMGEGVSLYWLGLTDADGEGWTPLFDPEIVEFEGTESWVLNDDGVLEGAGPRDFLVSERSDLAEFELRAQVKLSDGGNSGILFGDHEVQLNCSFPDPEKTGSLVGLAPVKTHLLAPDTWFELSMACRAEAGGTRITVDLNGIRVTDHLDPGRLPEAGPIRLEQHHEGSTVEFRALRVRAF